MIRDLVVFVVWTIVVLTVAGLALTAGALYWMVRHQRRRNRFGRRDRLTAPVTWLYAPGEAPRLHRRLLGSVACARRAVEARSSLSSVAAELEERAGAVDDGLILASRLAAPARPRALADLRPLVGEIEEVAERMARLATQRDLDVGPLHQRLDALEEAHRELAALEQPPPS